MRTWIMAGLLCLWLAGEGALAQQNRPANGLKGEYFNGPNFERKVLTRTDSQVDFNWNWEPPGPGVQREYFSVRWTGKLYAPKPGRYRFSATVDDGVRVWVNGQKVIDEWRKQDDSRFVGEITLKGGQFYDLRIEYYNDWKGSVVSVFWEIPQDRRVLSGGLVPSQVIPTDYLFAGPVRPRPVAPAAARPKPVAVRPLSVSAAGSSPIRPTPGVPVSFKQGRSAEVPVSQPFAQLKRGETVVLKNVFFAQSQYTLLPESATELDKLVEALRVNPDLRIDIVGHTDNVGDARLNQALSENRAKVVANYLIRHGIADVRLTAKGYGGSRPLVDNGTEEQRAQNRRVECIVR